MLDIFSGLRLVVKRRSINIDNAIFRCHWFFTSTLLVSFSLIITARQYVGQPIECHSVDKIPESLLNSYCWVQSTFTVPQACNQQVGTEIPYPCIDNTRGREIKVFAYYQWVGIVLFIQGLLFHMPYYLWKIWENGLIRAITGGLRVAVLTDQDRTKKQEIVIDYIYEHLGCHRHYALKYFLCEFICLINLIGQLWATNNFFEGQFLRYGLDVMQYSSNRLGLSQSSSINQNLTSLQGPFPSTKVRAINNIAASHKQVDPMIYIFPRITKCIYYDFGGSGDIQKHDALCLLPLNIINEKIYIALWFWFLILALLTLLVIVYRLCSAFECIRYLGLITRCKLSREDDIETICKHCDLGDWFLFYMVADNLDPLIMREIVSSIATKIKAHLDEKRVLLDKTSQESGYKFKSLMGDRYRASLSFDESLPSIRRNSMADEVPLMKKVKRKLSKRLWSMDLGSGDLRQQFFGRQLPTNPDAIYHQEVSSPALLADADTSSSVQSQLASAPPAKEMSPEVDPPTTGVKRRAHLTRTDSMNSDSFVVNMAH